MSDILMSIEDIKEVLQHRYPFLLIDKIVEFVDKERIKGIKNVTYNEPFFQGHFPSKAVMPGVLVIEALAQTGAVFAHKCSGGVPHGKLIYLVGVKDFRWKKQICPGDTLIIDVFMKARKSNLWIMEGEVSVDGKVVAKGTLSAAEQR